MGSNCSLPGHRPRGFPTVVRSKFRSTGSGRPAPGRTLTIHRVDVFTRAPLAGNAAGVVLDADGLSDFVMQSIAREMSLSETAFVFEEHESGVVPVRFFTPSQEVPVCGHATLAAHFVRATRQGALSGAVTQVSPGARWEVHWRPEGDRIFLFMRQGPVDLGPAWGDGARRPLLRALGIQLDGLVPGAPVRVVSTGHAKVMVPIRSVAELDRIRPDMAALRRLSAATGVGGYFLFALDAGPDTLTACRMFGPAIGVPEDPVNGSGHGPLGAYLADRGGAASAAAERGFWSRMGERLGRPGRVWVRALPGEGVVEVGGFAAPVFEAEIRIDTE